MYGQAEYGLRHLPIFWDDLNGAVTYVSSTLENPAAASRLLDQTELAILDHLKNPAFATAYRGKRSRKHRYYWFAVGNHMVFYVVIGHVMEVRRFPYGARDLTRVVF